MPAAATPAVGWPARVATTAGDALVELCGASYRYADGAGLAAFSIAVRAGETLAIQGRNGAGKSTAIKLAAGLLAPQAGSVRIVGEDPVVLGPQEVAEIAALVFQDPDDQIFNPRVEDEIGWGLKLRGVQPHARAARVRAVMRELGLGGLEDAHPYELSRSGRQLVALASALVVEPRVLLLDEPTTSLDVAAEALALVAVERRRAAGAAVLLVTHDAVVARRWADRVVGIGT